MLNFTNSLDSAIQNTFVAINTKITLNKSAIRIFLGAFPFKNITSVYVLLYSQDSTPMIKEMKPIDNITM